KAFFDENWAFPSPVQPSTDGLSLQPYAGTLTVGGELNKLASNIGLARNMCGDHWRSDTTQSLRLGEAIALKVLTEQAVTFNEPQAGMSLTRFDGTTVTV
ncbi:MAG TPA: twin-arginine translocation pathway signal protein, partial [Burkholderiaceae bacterium]|nr:twin-arginine translocation pathway signal protein [Burkholderiaceae bacterium]